jgi:signal transduction histidine kinase
MNLWNKTRISGSLFRFLHFFTLLGICILELWQMIFARRLRSKKKINRKRATVISEHAFRRKEALYEIQLTNKLLEHAQKIAKTGHYRFNFLTNELTWSKELYMIYLRDPKWEPPSNEEHKKLMAEGDWERIKELQLDGCKTGEQMMTEYSIYLADGVKRNLLLVIDWEKDGYGNIISEISTVQDISDRKQFEKKIFETIIETEENERATLAENLHDDVGPLLSSLNMYLSLISRDDCPNRKELMQTMNKILSDTITTVREISNNLSPHVLSNYGLIAALEDCISLKQKLIKIELNHNIEFKRFDSKIETTCYRIVKELINNTLKYAKANHIFISVLLENNMLKLFYRDDGLGFNINETMNQEHKGSGLLNIISRVKTINGNHRIVSNSGEGFLFELYVELNS